MAGDAHIVVVDGPGAGRQATVQLGGRSSIGRHSPSALLIPDASVSKTHVELENTPSGLRLTLVGKNGASLDGRKLPRKGVVVRFAARLQIGPATLAITFDPPPRPPRGVTFERWLGRGETGTVFAGRMAGVDQPVAVKIVHPDSAQPWIAARIRREAAILERLTHPAIVRFHALLEHAGELFLVEELVNGPLLEEVLSRGPLPWRRAVALGETLAAALAHAHGCGVIHRDISPSNIFIEEPGGAAKLADFGYAREAQRQATIDGTYVTKTNDALGTFSYVAPEQIGSAREASPAVDVYGLGAVLYHALAGVRAFAAVPINDYVRAAFRGATPLHEIAPHLPPSVCHVVMNAMNPLYEERPGAAILAKELRKLVSP